MIGLLVNREDLRECRVVIARGSGFASPQQLGAALVERDDLGFGAAEIDADAYQR